MSLYIYIFGATPKQSQFWKMSKVVTVTKKLDFISLKGILSFILYLYYFINNFTESIHTCFKCI